MDFRTLGRELAEEANYNLHPFAARLLNQRKGISALENFVLHALKENARRAAESRLPLCQDTGTAVILIEGFFPTPEELSELEKGVREAYAQRFRNSEVTDPLNRKLSSRYGPVNFLFLPRSKRKRVWLMAKGGGSEALSSFKQFLPSDSAETIARWVKDVVAQKGASACPPLFLGIGLGGTLAECALNAELALFFIDEETPNPVHKELEEKIEEMCNSLEIGLLGFGCGPTVLKAKVVSSPTHIATNPVALCGCCHSLRISWRNLK